jgi:hypothetical protein
LPLMPLPPFSLITPCWYFLRFRDDAITPLMLMMLTPLFHYILPLL